MFEHFLFKAVFYYFFVDYSFLVFFHKITKINKEQQNTNF